MRDVQTKQSKGYGFVKYVKFEDAVNAKEKLHGKFVKDKQLQIKFASTDSNGLMGGTRRDDWRDGRRRGVDSHG